MYVIYMYSMCDVYINTACLQYYICMLYVYIYDMCIYIYIYIYMYVCMIYI